MRRFKKYPNTIWFGLTVLFTLCGICLFPSGHLHAQEEKPVPEGEAPVQEVISPMPETDPAAQENMLPITQTDSLVIVLDPGHGGDEEGGLYDTFIEKDMNLVVANSMKAELEKYEGVTVYLTRTGDQKLSLAERSAYAQSVNADFMFCLHFNLSREHSLFGAECWVSAFGDEYSKGYSFAKVEMQMLKELGLYSRGIKTRLNDKGTDYYGIIRTASELDVPCVLIEHCHMDHENDRTFCEGRDQWEAFGRLDAAAAAKYFRLKSDLLGVDYSDYQNIEVPVPDYVVRPDSTPPDVCMIDVVSQDMKSGEVTVQLSAADHDSGMLYYSYSCDGGETFSGLQRWDDKSRDTITFTMQVPPRIVPEIVVNGYNGYDLYTQSNLISLPSMDYKTEEEIAAEIAEKKPMEDAEASLGSDTAQNLTQTEPLPRTHMKLHYAPDTEEPSQVSFGYFMTVCLVCALLVMGMALSVVFIMRSRKKRRRRRRQIPASKTDATTNNRAP